MRVTVLAILAAVFGAAAPASAVTAPCAGFTDVEVANPFCPSVDWMKNRAITSGCGDGTAYCPDVPVSRLAMAAFMNRLGNFLLPTLVDTTGKALGVMPLPMSAMLNMPVLMRYHGKTFTIYMNSVSPNSRYSYDYQSEILYFEHLNCSPTGKTWINLRDTTITPQQGAVVHGSVTPGGPISLYLSTPFAVPTSRSAQSQYSLGTCVSFSAMTVNKAVEVQLEADISTTWTGPFVIR